MDTRHATLGRRTLEEIRQKRAAERLSKASSVSDLPNASNPSDALELRKSESGTRLSENNISGLVTQLQEMQKRNTMLEEENRNMTSKLHTKEVENNMIQKRLNDLEQNTIPSLRKALKDVANEKDAAVVAREDFSAQLRTIKKRLKEAEEEQYRAEEDAAALRAELNSLQQQAISGQLSSISSMAYSPDHMQAMEKELAALKSQLDKEARMRQQEVQKLAEEQARTSALISQKQELQEKLEAFSKSVTDVGAEKEKVTQKAFTKDDKERLEKQLHDMAIVVERLESSRQKLLMEIDSQSTEIEKLFEENSHLLATNQETMGVVAQWQNQVKECLKQNEDLRHMLDELRKERANSPSLNDKVIHTSKEGGNDLPHTSEILTLRGELVKEQSRAEALSAEVMQLSARLQQATQAFNTLAHIYKPVLRNIENNLIKMKQDRSAFSVQ